MDKEKFKYLRIYGEDSSKRRYEESTPTLWIDNRNIEESLNAIQEYDYKYIHLQTSQIDFLSDERLRLLKGISIQDVVWDLTPLLNFNLEQLTHLDLPKRMEMEFDFSRCPNLIFLGGRLPDSYKNIEALKRVKYLRIHNYRKSSFEAFQGMHQLRKLDIHSLACVNLAGLQNLSQLEALRLDRCPELENLTGLSRANKKLRKVVLYNCRKLKDLNPLTQLPKLEELRLYEIHRIHTFAFLDNLKALKTLHSHPDSVGVEQDDYYPLIAKLQALNQTSQLRSWPRLAEYLEGTASLGKANTAEPSELRTLLARSPILKWIRDPEDEFYWEIYSAENCHKAQQLLITLVDKLEADDQLSEAQKIELFKTCIIGLNQYNEALRGQFIETDEREALCPYLDQLADAAGINILDHGDGIADHWRDW